MHLVFSHTFVSSPSAALFITSSSTPTPPPPAHATPLPHRLCSPPASIHSQLKPLPPNMCACLYVSSQTLDNISARINSPDAGRGFASGRDTVGTCVVPAEYFLGTMGLFIKDDKPTSAKTHKSLWSYHSWDRLNCFLSVYPLPLHSPGCQCIRSCRLPSGT